MAERIDRGGFLRKLLFIDGGVEAARSLGGAVWPGAKTVTGARARIPFTFLRPPGAPLEPTFLARCTRCGLCEKACPEHIIVNATEPLLGAGTPIVDPCIAPCTECGKCIEACPDGALLPSEDRRMGRAVVHPETCLSTAEIVCTMCVESCPVGEAAIRAVQGHGIAISWEACTGCAFCYHVCPTQPKSIHLEGRPPVPLKGHPPVPVRHG